MATNFPTSLDSFTDRISGDTIAEGDVNDPHDAIEAIEVKVGINSSTVNTTIDYILKNTTGGHDHDGSDSKLLTGLGAWASKTNNTSYLAEADGFVIAYAGYSDLQYVIGYSDASNPPTTVRARCDTYSSAAVVYSITFPVRKGNYYKVLGSTDVTTVWWIPLGV